MMSKRMPLALALSAVLFVTSGFAATKKIQTHDRSEDWSDSPLMSGSLLSTGSSVPSDGSPSLSVGSLKAPSLVPSPGSPDNWNGGTGFWSDTGNWSAGAPGASSDVTIYSGGYDTATLDTSPTISSLVVGGASNGTTSELADGGVAQTLTISNGLTTGASGILSLTGGSTVTAGAGSSNAGLIDLENASTLGITGNFTNSGTIRIVGNSLATMYGFNNMGYVKVQEASTLRINGDVWNSGSAIFNTGFIAGSGGNNKLNITGDLTNAADFGIRGAGDIVTIGGSVDNNGTIDLTNGSTLTANGGISNSGILRLSLSGLEGNTLTIPGQIALTNNATGLFAMYGDGAGDTATIGVVNNFGTIDVQHGSGLEALNYLYNAAGGSLLLSGSGTKVSSDETLENNGFINLENGAYLFARDITNSGTIATGFYGGSGGNTLEVVFGLTNNAGGSFTLNGPGDMSTIGSLTNNAGALVDVENGSTLTVTGDVTNASIGMHQGIFTGLNGTGGNTLNIGGTLTNNGLFSLVGAMDQATIFSVTNYGMFGLVGAGSNATLGSLTNHGEFAVANGSMLQVNGDLVNEGELLTGYIGGGANTVNITGMLLNLGQIALIGPGDMMTIDGDLNNDTTVDIEGGSTLNVGGNVDNPGTMETNALGGHGGGNTITVTGMLTNEVGGQFTLNGPGDKATIGSLVNSGTPGMTGTVDVENGSALNIVGDVTNSGVMATDLHKMGGGNTLSIGGNLTNNWAFGLLGAGDMGSISGNVTNNVNGQIRDANGAMGTIGGSLTNSGLVDVENGSTLTIDGNASNSGQMFTDLLGLGGGNTIAINGTLTNSPGAVFSLLNPTDRLIINGGIGLSNGASLSTPTLNNGGTINVDSLSTLLVGMGVLHGPITNYTQLANGTLGEIINNYGPLCGVNGNCGLINVTGSALLAGTLDILLKQGFNPTLGSEFKFLFANPGQITGTFASILLNGMYDAFNCTDKTCDYFDPNVDSADGYVEVTVKERPVPEPATLLVLIPGLLGVGYGLRRKLLR